MKHIIILIFLFCFACGQTILPPEPEFTEGETVILKTSNIEVMITGMSYDTYEKTYDYYIRHPSTLHVVGVKPYELKRKQNAKQSSLDERAKADRSG